MVEEPTVWGVARYERLCVVGRGDRTTQVTPFMSGHPHTVDAQYLANMWCPDEVRERATEWWPEPAPQSRAVSVDDALDSGEGLR
jgi:hypothetical protein